MKKVAKKLFNLAHMVLWTLAGTSVGADPSQMLANQPHKAPDTEDEK